MTVLFGKRLRPDLALVMVAALLVLQGCMYRGENFDNPIMRRATWFSFAAGEDIKAACGPNAPDRFRVIYNGFWHEQVRIYEWGGAGEPASLNQRILAGLSVSFFTTTDWRAPWRGEVTQTPLSKADQAQLAAALSESGMFDPPPIGLLLPSDGYYWTAVGCHAGQFYYNAWLHPSDRFAAATFPAALMARDRTGVALNQPDPYGNLSRYDRRTQEDERWYIQVQKGGLSTSGSF